MPDVQQGLKGKSSDFAVELKGNFTWGFSNRQRSALHSIDNYIDLKGIDFKVKSGEFVCVIGTVGSGKSSLL